MHDFGVEAGALEETIAAGSVAAAESVRELRPALRREPGHELETLVAPWLRSIDGAAAFASVSAGCRPHHRLPGPTMITFVPDGGGSDRIP